LTMLLPSIYNSSKKSCNQVKFKIWNASRGDPYEGYTVIRCLSMGPITNFCLQRSPIFGEVTIQAWCNSI
ncbi:MAG: hypothetical protein WA460_00150, partial [Nitrososphaeraceae archaeon]